MSGMKTPDTIFKKNQKIYLGETDNFSIFYDPINNDFRIRDETNGKETNLPKNVAMNLASHAERHEPGGADPTTAYIQGASTGKLSEGGTLSGDDAKSTYSYAVALSAVDNVSTAVHTQNGTQPGDTRLDNVGTSSSDIGYPDPGNAADSHTTETMGLTVIGDA